MKYVERGQTLKGAMFTQRGTTCRLMTVMNKLWLSFLKDEDLDQV